MNFALKVGPLVAEILSGFTALVLGYFDLNGLDFKTLKALSAPEIVGVFVLAWLLGTLFDVIRNLLEWLWDCRRLVTKPLNWRFFFEGDEQRLANLEHYFYSFYMLDADMAISILLFVFLGRWIISVTIGPAHVYSEFVRGFLFFIATLFALDAMLLRWEIKRYLDEENTAH